jgi:hypothetical protein
MDIHINQQLLQIFMICLREKKYSNDNEAERDLKRTLFYANWDLNGGVAMEKLQEDFREREDSAKSLDTGSTD